jgi:ribosome-associated protein|tara:strand:+ start:17597 stop:17926 length:330 start_codon:yes stop_codon:yes gene_type:complete
LTSISNIKKNVISALEDIKAFDIISIDIRKQASIADYIIIASANSSRQAKALADNIKDEMQKINISLIGMEGGSGSEWVLVDLGDIIIHIMTPTIRAHYNLEEIWVSDN